MATREREVKKTMIVLRNCRIKEYGESTAKPVTPGLIVEVPIEDVSYLASIKCAEIYTGDTPVGQFDKKVEKKQEKTEKK